MKKLFKILTACIAITLLIFNTVITAFAAQIAPELEAQLSDFSTGFIEYVMEINVSEYEELIALCEEQGDTVDAEMLKSAKNASAQNGQYVSIGTPAVTMNEDGGYTITTPVKYTNGSCNAVMVMTPELTLSSFLFTAPEEKQPLGQLMKDASVNLVVGMGTVFAVLIFLCWVISLFKYIHAAEEKLNKKQISKAEEKAPAVSVTQVSGASGSDDEIQAVIAAAIAAYESEKEGSIVKQGALCNGKTIRTYRR